MKKQKYHTIGTLLKSNRTMVETNANTKHLHDRSYSCIGQVKLLEKKNRLVNLCLPRSKMMGHVSALP
jgi:hypothetical protein